MEISVQSQKAIKGFLQQWWEALTWQAHETVAGAQIMVYAPKKDEPGEGEHRPAYLTADQLYDQLLGHTLREIAAAAEGLLPDEQKGEVYEACQHICEWMFARPGMPATYGIPREWWNTPMGALCGRAFAWSQGDELIPLTEAAELLAGPDAAPGRVTAYIKSLSKRADKDTLWSIDDPSELNPRKRRRVRRRDVLALIDTRREP